jgi:uncharacterized membrane protein YphA (DoxX/SURF4 family)
MTLHGRLHTRSEVLAGVIRLLLGVLFVMTGLMKLLVPALTAAWSGQLLAADRPFYTLTRWTVPFIEVGVGIVLLAGVHTRLAGGVVVAIVAVATYVHFVVHDPALFPLQPTQPIIPIVVIVLAAYVMRRGAGAWSGDLKVTHPVA